MRPGTRQQGFNLMEMLLVSLLGGGILLGAGQLFTTQLSQHARQQQSLLLESQARLAKLALIRDLKASNGVVQAGAARHSYPSGNEYRMSLTASTGAHQTVAYHFNSASDSDWLLLQQPRGQGDRQDLSLWHRDEKSHGGGLAHKPASSGSVESSQTLIPDVELLRFRFQENGSHWKTAAQISNWQAVHSVQFALLLKSAQPLPGHKNPPIRLWGETLQPPQDQHLRLVFSHSLTLQKGAAHEP